MGRGAFPDRHPLSLSMPGMHGTAYANWAIRDCDLLIAVGVRFDDRVTGKMDEFAPRREQVIHIDLDPSSISKAIPSSIPIVGDCRRVLKKLVKLVEPKTHPEPALEP